MSYLLYLIEPLEASLYDARHIDVVEMYSEIQAILNLECYKTLLLHCIGHCFFMFQLDFRQHFGQQGKKRFAKITVSLEHSFQGLLQPQKKHSSMHYKI